MYLLVPQKSSTMDGDIHGSGVARAESLHSSLHSSSDQPNNIRGRAFQQDPAGRSDSPELLMRSSFGMQLGGGSWSQTATNSNKVMHFSTSMASRNIPVVGSCPALLQTRQVPQAAGSTFKILQPEISAMRVGRNVHGLNNCEPSPQVVNGSTSYAADDQRLGPRLMTRGNSWSALDVLNTAMGSALSHSSQCLARSFSSSPGFGEPRVAKFSSSGFNGNLYSQTQYSLPGSDGVGGIRSIMGGDNDGTKISRSFSCSRLANLAAPSNITDVRISQYDALAESKISCEIEATTMEQEARSKSAAMQYDDKKPQTRRIPGDPITSMVEAFEGATETGGGPRHDTADEPDGSLEHSSCAEQAHGRTLQRLDCIGKRKLLQADEEEAACKEPSMANSVAPSAGRDSGSQLAAAVGPAADGDETKFAVKRRRSGVEIITKEDAKFQSVDRTLNCETSYSAGESLSSLVSMKESCTVTSLMQQDYIHVRARRGEATDSHSIAERVRREKISERMKYLQELVPGCNKVTGKAVMLDEIINYVQSLQLQVEFLSMKLAAVNLSRLDFDVDISLPKELLCASMAPSMSLMGPDPTAMSYGHQQQLLQQCQFNNLQSVGSSDLDQFRALDSAFEASLPRTMTTAVCTPLSCLDAFADNLQQSEQSTYQVHGKESYRVSSTWDLCKAGQLAPQELHCTILFRHDMLLHGPIDTSLKCWIFQQS